MSMISDTSRLELEAFRIKVIELKTGNVNTNFSTNLNENRNPALLGGSIYEPAREKLENILRSEAFDGNGSDPHVWAQGVVSDVLKKHPPTHVYRGESAWFARILPMLPFGILDGKLKKVIGLDVVEKSLEQSRV